MTDRLQPHDGERGDVIWEALSLGVDGPHEPESARTAGAPWLLVAACPHRGLRFEAVTDLASRVRLHPPETADSPRTSMAIEAVDETRRLRVANAGGTARLTHYLFRFPAKFHAPVVAALFNQFTEPSDIVLDPFVGSGTALIEGVLLDRKCIGVDVDPVAVAVSRAKTRRYDIDDVKQASERLLAALKPLDRGAEEYSRLAFDDLSSEEVADTLTREKLWVPAIPNLEHWFRRYVIVDLARIHRQVVRRRADEATKALLFLFLGSIVRNASNADPVPVSGLEVTSHMRRLDEAGRVVDPFALMRKAVSRGVAAVEAWMTALHDRDAPLVLDGDATADVAGLPAKVDAVITSPPYHNAVDYYRRHQLEMFWLRMTPDQTSRLELLPHYIGRPRIRASHPLLAEPWPSAGLAAEWERDIAAVSAQRATDFRHYMLAMSRVMRRIAERTDEGAPVVMVVGQSAWNGGQIPTVSLFEEISKSWFETEATLWYPVRNRYMSYTRHNGASIDREHVVVLRRSGAPVGALA